MKFRLEVDPGAEEELVLRVRELNAQALRLQKWASDLLVEKAEMKLYRGDTEYYVPFETILFFESGEHRTAVHTAMQIYTTELRLYELEQLLPHTFVRCALGMHFKCQRNQCRDKISQWRSRDFFLQQ